MAQVTSPIILDSTGQQIHSDLQQIKNVLTTPSAAADITFDNTGTGMQADDVQDAITELKSNLTVNTANIQGDINASWNGILVTIDFGGSADTTIASGSSSDIGTLPNDVPKPSANKYFVGSLGANQNKYLIIAILTDGKIRVFNYSGTSATYLYGSITYFAS